jgi:UDP-N-acetylglucosamine/UDP-N-acetylgalactosamine diphosphorylase
MVGPCRLAFGTIAAAGTIVRKDELRPGHLLFGGLPKASAVPYQPGHFGNSRRAVVNNIVYIANLMALHQWYRHVRRLFVSKDFSDLVLTGLKEKLNWAISERIDRLEAFCHKINEDPTGSEKVVRSKNNPAAQQRQTLLANWSQLRDFFEQFKTENGDKARRDTFLKAVQKNIPQNDWDYISVIQQLAPLEKELATTWLQGIVDLFVNGALKIIPSFK